MLDAKFWDLLGRFSSSLESTSADLKWLEFLSVAVGEGRPAGGVRSLNIRYSLYSFIFVLKLFSIHFTDCVKVG